MDDNDLCLTFDRNTFLKLNTKIKDSITALIKKVMDQMAKMNIKLDTIELVGEASRTPFLLSCIESVEALKGETTRRTLNT